MMKLSVERLFSSPPLAATLPADLKFSPDGRFIAWLQPAEDDRERLDLWRYELATGSRECWVNAKRLADQGEILSDAEKAERERRRVFSTGITRYEFDPGGEYVLIPADGTGYRLSVGSGELARFTPEGTRQTDFTISPKGSFISFVRSGDLYCYDCDNGEEQRLTHDGVDTISNGIAEFIAQEEMHRFEGHWWSPDESAIAYTRVDESCVAESHRYEIDADAFNVIPQRYPFAGEANAEVQLLVRGLADNSIRVIDFQDSPDDYLARVNWWGNALAVQVQSRDQKQLRLKKCDPRTGGMELIVEETSPTWINLHDNFTVIGSQDEAAEEFLWTSERDGFSHLFHYADGALHQLTRGEANVGRIHHAGEEHYLVSGWFDIPVEQHLYAVPAGGGSPRTLTTGAGWHEVCVDVNGEWALDRTSSLDCSGGIRLLKLESGAVADRLEIVAQPPGDAHPYHEFLDAHCAPVLGSITAEDGQSLHYRLTRPRSPGGARPLVVYVYGGPGVRRVRNEWPPLLLQLFAQRGIGVLELDNRGSSERGRDFEAPILGQMGRAEVADQLAGARFAQSLDWVAENRIGVFGHSYGGYMTLMCLCQAPQVFKAGVAVAPVSRWELYDTHYTERYLGTPKENPGGYEDSSVFPHLSKMTGKLLLMHGMADDNVLFTHTTSLMKALQSQGFAFDLMTYPGSKHALQEKDVSIHRFNMILDFFERNL